eukprot:6239035-Amphidinium_carterae.1
MPVTGVKVSKRVLSTQTFAISRQHTSPKLGPLPFAGCPTGCGCAALGGTEAWAAFGGGAFGRLAFTALDGIAFAGTFQWKTSDEETRKLLADDDDSGQVHRKPGVTSFLTLPMFLRKAKGISATPHPR